MSNTLNDSTTWHMDGHSIYMQLHKNELVIQVISCPGHDERECNLAGFDCIVEWFLTRFGLDCNVGVSEISSNMEIAWSIQGDPTDPDLCQVWVIPVADEAFASWLATQTPSINET
jgi:hypothetical protein